MQAEQDAQHVTSVAEQVAVVVGAKSRLRKRMQRNKMHHDRMHHGLAKNVP